MVYFPNRDTAVSYEIKQPTGTTDNLCEFKTQYDMYNHNVYPQKHKYKHNLYNHHERHASVCVIKWS